MLRDLAGLAGLLLWVLGVLASPTLALAAELHDVDADEALCRQHTAKHAKETWRQPAGVLAYPYLVPAGPYEQEWDWDSVYLGVATFSWGSREYLAGSMKNFFAATNRTTGEVTGCLTKSLPTVCSSDPTKDDALYHAKPILIQGAWLAAAAPGGNPREFKEFATVMRALLSYWDRPPRLDVETGLRVWHDMMETGADNNVLSQCPNARSTECWTESQAFTLASPDVMVFFQREHVAFSLFLEAWAAEGGNDAASLAAEALEHRAQAEDIKRVLNERLWREDLGYHVAFNTSSRKDITNRTYQIAFPIWGGLVNGSQAAAIAATLAKPDMLAGAGLRSTSAEDPRYSNADTILPYSNWRGPMWVNANAMACYGLAAYGHSDLALDIAGRVVKTLADDLRHSGEWHEAYSTDNGSALAAPGFLSWDTLSAELVSNLRSGVDPMALGAHAQGVAVLFA